MIPPRVDYRRAASVDDALALLADVDGEAVLLAGGHGLVPDMKVGAASPDVLVDIRDVPDLGDVRVDPDADRVSIGALATHADLASAEALSGDAALVAEAATHVADLQIRNRGTIGGNLAEADPGADLPPAVVATDATIEVRGLDGTRTVDAGDFVHGAGRTALSATEVLTRVHVSTTDGGTAYVRKTHPASGYAAIAVAARAAVEDAVVTDARIAVGGLTDRPTVLDGVAAALVGATPDADAIASAAERADDALDAADCRGDEHASARYRRGVLSTYVERAVTTAVERARGDDGA